ncbi:preprotein translocase subunit SecE [Roseomonas sp. USHLN139]|uniref:preprotein translocase subunit SecE n=1 Tax=Roseomonas sp. USHLN139 TaxID=3081298 RepID=UPI003B020103
MAEATHQIDYVEVKADDIIAERTHGWEAFTKATTWGIGATILILALLYLFAG